MKKILAFVFCLAAVSFAAEPVTESPSAATPAVEAPAAQAPVDEMQKEIAVRDSVMQVQSTTCSMEKDSLRAAIESEKAKSDNWEKSYNTIKKDNETCAKMLSTSIGVNENKKEKEEQERRRSAMATSTSFLSGFGVGMLVMWLIMK